MTQTLLPATSVLQGTELARPGARPAASGVGGDDAFAARLARAQAQAQAQPQSQSQSQTEPCAPAPAAATPEVAAPAAEPTTDEHGEQGEAPGLAAEVFAAIAFAPSTPSTPLAVPVMPAHEPSPPATTDGPTAAAAASAEGAVLSPAAGTELRGKSKGAAGATTPLPHAASAPAAAANALPAPSSARPAGFPPDPASPSAEPVPVQARDDTAKAPPGEVRGTPTPTDSAAALPPFTLAPAPTPASALGPAPATTAHAAAPSLHIAAAVDTPTFAPALAQQVSWLVREGVGLASLQLNPPELGPVSVQIVVEGRQARVDFGAELALTRSAIEDSLPRLASALQDIGLTLSGGGVFDGRQRREAQAPPAERSRAADDAALAAGPPGARAAALQAPRGLVDLVA